VLETNNNNNKYPKEPWFQAYTNGSNMADCVNTGAGVFSDLSSFYAPVGHIRATFHGEVEVI
jgi:hypothetical protein